MQKDVCESPLDTCNRRYATECIFQSMTILISVEVRMGSFEGIASLNMTNSSAEKGEKENRRDTPRNSFSPFSALCRLHGTIP